MSFLNGEPRPLAVAVQLDGVAKAFAGSVALHPLSLAIHEGELVALIGPSGCGKSVLLNLVAGLDQPDQGTVHVDGRPAAEALAQQRDIGIVSPGYALVPHLTVATNVGYALRMRGTGKSEIASRIEQVLAVVRLAGLGERKVRDLSGGEQQRVALARALIIRPKVLLLDEPFSGLDKNLRRALQLELKDIQHRLGVTILLATHDQDEALRLGDRVALMRAGRVHQVGTPDSLYRRPQDAFVAGFVGDVNILPGRYVSCDRLATLEVGDSVVHLPAERISAEVGARLALYVRPENVRMAPLGPRSQLTATVVARVFQGDHVDLYLDVPALGNKRLIVRQPGLDALARWPVGAAAGLSLEHDGLCAFAAAPSIEHMP